MAAPNIGPPAHYHVEDSITGKKHFPHHESISALWKTKWRMPCSMGIYPFVDGKVEDFDPIFEELSKSNNDETRVFYEPDTYAAPFIPVAKSLMAKAAEAESASDTGAACDLYLRAGAVLRIARFPIIRSKISRQAWELGKEAYAAGGKYLDPPNREIAIPFTHADTYAGDEDHAILAYLRVPTGTRPAQGWPVLFFICGLDAYRPDYTGRMSAHNAAGFATLSFEIPGTGDCPAARNDPASSDRLMWSVLDWIASAQGGRSAEFGPLDPATVVARGVSTGGYNALRVTLTHGDRLVASVVQGGGCHFMFDERWIRAQNAMEYPFALAEALACKFGYGDGDDGSGSGVEAYIKDKPLEKFSLVRDGLLDGPAGAKANNATAGPRVLLINGWEDSIFPVEDSLLAASRGRVKDVRLLENRQHVGNPGAEQIVMDWIAEVTGVTGKEGGGSKWSY